MAELSHFLLLKIQRNFKSCVNFVRSKQGVFDKQTCQMFVFSCGHVTASSIGCICYCILPEACIIVKNGSSLELNTDISSTSLCAEIECFSTCSKSPQHCGQLVSVTFSLSPRSWTNVLAKPKWRCINRRWRGHFSSRNLALLATGTSASHVPPRHQQPIQGDDFCLLLWKFVYFPINSEK